MILIKNNIECVITIDDPNTVLSNNINEIILNILKEKFEGKCYSSCYILNVNKIMRRSLIYCNENLDANFNVNIVFEAKVIIYQENEIINDCEIVKKEQNGIVHGKTKYGGVQLNIQHNMAIFNTGEKIPIIVKKIRYNINQPEISILAMPFIPIEYDIVFYKTINNLSSDEYNKLFELNNQLIELDKSINKLDKNQLKIFKFFKDIMSDYKLKNNDNFDKYLKNLVNNNKMYKILKDNKTINIDLFINELKTNKQKEYILFRNYKSYDSSYCNKIELSNLIDDEKNMFKTNEDTPFVFISENIYKILELYIYENIQTKQTLLNFIESYPTFKHVEKSKNIWKLYLMLKNK